MAEADQPEVRVPAQFEAFYRQEYPAVLALSYALTGSRPVAEDLTQEAFLRAHREWDRVGRMAAPGAWVRTVAVNLCRSWFRRVRSEAAARVRLAVAPVTLAAPAAEYDMFWAEVRRLPHRQAQAIALHYANDLSVVEIAAVLEVAEGTVKALLHQGRHRLEERLRAKGWADEAR
jgi:RNA polymerase sigma-70 factor (ECF subfamily)